MTRLRPTLIAALCALALPASASALDDISIKGNHFVAGGHQVRLIGVDRSGSEYACAVGTQRGNLGFSIFQGPVDDTTIKPMLDWKVNTVALPLNEACWLGGYAPGLKPEFSGTAYRNAILDYVNRLNAHGLYVVLRLSGAAPGAHAFLEPTANGQESDSMELPAPDRDHAENLWRSVAQTFKGNHKVLFHLYDEPNDDAQISWTCLFHGCSGIVDKRSDGSVRYGRYTTVGYDQLIADIRGTGASQPILLSGRNFAAEFDGWLANVSGDAQLAANVDTFDYARSYFDGFFSDQPDLKQISQTHPVVFGGFGDTDCNSDYSREVMRWADDHNMSYLAWTWNTEQDYGGCGNALLNDANTKNGQPAGYYSGAPSGFGAGVKLHFVGLSSPAPQLVPATLKLSALVGAVYTGQFDASGNPQPTIGVASGMLPPGLKLDPNSGALTGRPTTPGDYKFTIRATNTVGHADSAPYTIHVTNAPPGTVLAFGDNTEGELGNGTSDPATIPTPVAFPAGAGPITRVAAGEYHALAIDNTGKVYAWGDNGDGALGIGTSEGTQRAAAAVHFPARAPRIVALAAGYKFSAALDAQGHVWTWGDNAVGELGNGSGAAFTTTPAQIALGAADGHVTAIAATGQSMVALTDTGKLLSWGSNDVGQLGNGTNAPSRAPVAVQLPAAAGPIASVAAGDLGAGTDHVLALTRDGRVYAWGSNAHGMLGDGTTDNRSLPVLVRGVGGAGTLQGVAAIGAGGFHDLAVRSDGSVVAWGDNEVGELGDASTTSHATPVVVHDPQGGKLPPVAAVAGGWFHSLALTRTGKVLGFGGGLVNALGNGQPSPATQTTPSRTVLPSPTTVIAQVAARDRFSLALVGSAPPGAGTASTD